MVDIQIRGADGLAGAYGIGPFGLSYSVSGGTNGVQVQFQIAAFDLPVKGTYSSGYKDDAGNLGTNVPLRIDTDSKKNVRPAKNKNRN